MKHYAVLVLLIYIMPGNQTWATDLESMSISYTIRLQSKKYGNATLGKIETSLSKEDNRYSVSSKTRAQGIAAILLGSNYREACEFDIESERAVSRSYMGGRRNLNGYKITFDWTERKINFANGESLDMPKGYVVDQCNMLFAAALLKDQGLDGESIYIVDGKKKRIRGYRQTSISEERLSTELGEMDTYKIVLARELVPERTLTLWLAPDYSYIPIKMVEQRSSRKTTFIVDEIVF